MRRRRISGGRLAGRCAHRAAAAGGAACPGAEELPTSPRAGALCRRQAPPTAAPCCPSGAGEIRRRHRAGARRRGCRAGPTAEACEAGSVAQEDDAQIEGFACAAPYRLGNRIGSISRHGYGRVNAAAAAQQSWRLATRVTRPSTGRFLLRRCSAEGAALRIRSETGGRAPDVLKHQLPLELTAVPLATTSRIKRSSGARLATSFVLGETAAATPATSIHGSGVRLVVA